MRVYNVSSGCSSLEKVRGKPAPFHIAGYGGHFLYSLHKGDPVKVRTTSRV